jgi:hypothetical protein
VGVVFVTNDVGVVVVAGLLFKGAPTAISHLCPGCPCGGFIPGAVLTAGEEVVTTGCVLAAGLLSNGAPTAISHLCPGCPCGGFIPAGVTGIAEAVAGTAAGTG